MEFYELKTVWYPWTDSNRQAEAPDFESGVFTNFTTRARKKGIKKPTLLK